MKGGGASSIHQLGSRHAVGNPIVRRDLLHIVDSDTNEQASIAAPLLSLMCYRRKNAFYLHMRLVRTASKFILPDISS